MTKAEKNATIEALKEKFSSTEFFYLTDSSTLTVEEVNKYRGLCYEKGIEMRVIKNTLARKALESLPEEKGYEGLYESLKGPTAVLFTEVANSEHKYNMVLAISSVGTHVEKSALGMSFLLVGVSIVPGSTQLMLMLLLLCSAARLSVNVMTALFEMQ